MKSALFKLLKVSDGWIFIIWKIKSRVSQNYTRRKTRPQPAKEAASSSSGPQILTLFIPGARMRHLGPNLKKLYTPTVDVQFPWQSAPQNTPSLKLQSDIPEMVSNESCLFHRAVGILSKTKAFFAPLCSEHSHMTAKSISSHHLERSYFRAAQGVFN